MRDVEVGPSRNTDTAQSGGGYLQRAVGFLRQLSGCGDADAGAGWAAAAGLRVLSLVGCSVAHQQHIEEDGVRFAVIRESSFGAQQAGGVKDDPRPMYDLGRGKKI